MKLLSRPMSVARKLPLLRQEEVRIRVRAVCCPAGVQTMLLPYYYSFGFEVDRLKGQDLEGETLALEVALAVSKWVTRGLSLPVLEAIRTQVFNVPALTP